MYWILHYLFGWDFIYWNDSVSTGITRIRKLPDGRYYYYYSIMLRQIHIIKKADQVTFLTCKPEKYFPEHDKSHKINQNN